MECEAISAVDDVVITASELRDEVAELRRLIGHCLALGWGMVSAMTMLIVVTIL